MGGGNGADLGREGRGVGGRRGGEEANEAALLPCEEVRGELGGNESVRAFFVGGLPPRLGVVLRGGVPRLPAEEDSLNGRLETSGEVSRNCRKGCRIPEMLSNNRARSTQGECVHGGVVKEYGVTIIRV